MGFGGQLHNQGAFHLGMKVYPLCRRLGGTQDRYGPMRKTSPSSGFVSLDI